MMQHNEFIKWLSDEVKNDRMTKLQKKDLLNQKKIFDKKRKSIEKKHTNKVVGYVKRKKIVAGTVHEMLDKAKGKGLVYFESIGFNLF